MGITITDFDWFIIEQKSKEVKEYQPELLQLEIEIPSKTNTVKETKEEVIIEL